MLDTEPYVWSLLPIANHNNIDLFSNDHQFLFPSLKFIFSRIMADVVDYLQQNVWRDNLNYQVNVEETANVTLSVYVLNFFRCVN